MFSQRTRWPSCEGITKNNDSSSWLQCFSFNKRSQSEWCSVASWMLVYHDSAALCIQMSSNVFHSLLQQRLPNLSMLQIQLILLMPLGLNQYAWLKVSVINTRVVFRKHYLSPLLLICTWTISSVALCWVHVVRNQHTFTVAVILKGEFIPEHRGKMHIHDVAHIRTCGMLWQTLVMNGEGMTSEEVILFLLFSSILAYLRNTSRNKAFLFADIQS